jgi:hypothetical protein
MKTAVLIASGIILAALATASAPAQAKTMKECAAQWKELKEKDQTAGMKYRDFSKQCMSEGAAPAPEAKPAPTPPPPAAEKAAPPPPAKPAATTTPPATTTTTETKPMSPGRAAMIARERACGAEWKADKAAGKIPAGMHWPQYWSACDKRKKAQGA